MEKGINKCLLSMHSMADTKKDPHLTNFLEDNFLTEQVTAIKKFGDLITKLERAGDGLGVHIIDKELMAVWKRPKIIYTGTEVVKHNKILIAKPFSLLPTATYLMLPWSGETKWLRDWYFDIFHDFAFTKILCK